MNPIPCSICKKTNHIPERQVIIVSSFAQKLQAEEALFEIQKSHMQLAWHKVDKTMLILALHGIKDIVNLQALYIESICQTGYALTIDILSQKVQQEKLLSLLD